MKTLLEDVLSEIDDHFKWVLKDEKNPTIVEIVNERRDYVKARVIGTFNAHEIDNFFFRINEE